MCPHGVAPAGELFPRRPAFNTVNIHSGRVAQRDIYRKARNVNIQIFYMLMERPQ